MTNPHPNYTDVILREKPEESHCNPIHYIIEGTTIISQPYSNREAYQHSVEVLELFQVQVAG